MPAEPTALDTVRGFFSDLTEPAFPRADGVGFFNDRPSTGLSLIDALLLGALAGGAWLFIRSVR